MKPRFPWSQTRRHMCTTWCESSWSWWTCCVECQRCEPVDIYTSVACSSANSKYISIIISYHHYYFTQSHHTNITYNDIFHTETRIDEMWKMKFHLFRSHPVEHSAANHACPITDADSVLCTLVARCKAYEPIPLWQFRLQGKVRQMWICIVPCRKHTSKALRYVTRSQGISQLPAHPVFTC